MADGMAVTASGLYKTLGGRPVLRGLDLCVPVGSVLGVLGCNGAGKTTTVRVLTTLLAPDGGSATVAGFDVVRQPHRVRRHIALAGQYVAVDALLTGRENLVLIGRLLHLTRRAARARAEALLDRFALVDAADRPAGGYSGGMRRRLDLASCLVGEPSILFLDEPTTGLDPASRTVLWEAIRALVRDGMTVLMTTQYLEEADRLADRIVVVEAGRVIAEGTPDALKHAVGGTRLKLRLARPEQLGRAVAALGPRAELAVDGATGSLSLAVVDVTGSIASVAGALRSAEVDLAEFAVRRPSLDEVFLSLTDGPRPGRRRACAEDSLQRE